MRIETYAELRKDLLKYKEFKIKNASEIDEKIKKYLSPKTR